jgi:HTH-type transcriptional regulator, sugar sensing transcriptional regulator
LVRLLTFLRLILKFLKKYAKVSIRLNIFIKFMLEKDLQSTGLNEKEAKVYLAALELGQSTVQEIAQKAGVNRATAYFIIDGLMRHGLITSFHKGKKQYFMSADPDRLLEILEQEKIEIKKREADLKKLLPELQSMNNKKKDRPVVRYYEGKEGIAAMVDEFLKTKDLTISMAYSVDAVDKFFNDNDMQRWRFKRVERNITTKVIYTSKQGELTSAPKSEDRRVPLEKFPITCDIAIYDDKVRIASLGDRLAGIIIEDKEIAQSLQAIFDLAWEAAKNYKK